MTWTPRLPHALAGARGLRPALALLALAGLLAAGAVAAPPAKPARPAHPGPAIARPAAPDSEPQPDSTGQVIYSEPKLYMAWRAPWGMPGATDTLSISCDDTLRVDTLYLSFETGRDAPRFWGMYARLYFRPPFGDTLGTYWHWGRGWWNQGNLRIEFDPDGTFPCAQPWVRHGFGQPDFQFTPEAGRLDLIYALREADTAPVAAGTRYCFARVMFRQRQCHLPGARQPVCIEWTEARLSFGHGDVIATFGPARFVSTNSPDGGVCTPYRRARNPGAWKPKGPTNPNQPPPGTGKDE